MARLNARKRKIIEEAKTDEEAKKEAEAPEKIEDVETPETQQETAMEADDKEDKTDEPKETPEADKENDENHEGFTVLDEVTKEKSQKVFRVLPNWLAKPSVISCDLSKNKVPIKEISGIDKFLIEALKRNKVQHFFPGTIFHGLLGQYSTYKGFQFNSRSFHGSLSLSNQFIHLVTCVFQLQLAVVKHLLMSCQQFR